MITAFLALAAASTPYAAPPRLQAANIAEAFRSECISDAGVASGVQNWVDWMTFFDAHRATAQAVKNEVVNATKAIPFDIERYANALKADTDDQHYLDSIRNSYNVKLLRNLSSTDRKRWITRLTRGAPPPNNCTAK